MILYNKKLLILLNPLPEISQKEQSRTLSPSKFLILENKLVRFLLLKSALTDSPGQNLSKRQQEDWTLIKIIALSDLERVIEVHKKVSEKMNTSEV